MLPLPQPPGKASDRFDDWMFRLWKRTTQNLTSAQFASTITDETGTGLLVFNTTPTFATSVIGSASMDVFNTVSTTVNAFGAATSLSIGAATGTLTLNNAAVKFGAGTVGAPAIYLSTDTTTGFYRIGANNTGYAVSSSKVLDIASTGMGVTGAFTTSTGFGCNSKTAQTAYASGGALNAYGAGANGFDTGANASALHAMVVSIRAALVANGIMS